MMNAHLTLSSAAPMELTNDALPHMSMMYYLTNSPRRQKVVVDMEIPLPKTTWMRNPVRSNKKCGCKKDSESQKIEELHDCIELHLEDLKHMVIQEIPPFRSSSTTTATTTTPIAGYSTEEDEVMVHRAPARRTHSGFAAATPGRSNPGRVNRRRYTDKPTTSRQTPKRHASTSDRPKRLPPRSVTVPKNVFLDPTEERRTSTPLDAMKSSVAANR